MKQVKKYINFLLTLVVLFIGTSCEEFLDVNKKENDPTTVGVSTLLTASEVTIGRAFSIGTTLGNGLSLYTHQSTGRISADRYALLGTALGWNDLYAAMNNVDVIIEQGTGEGRLAYAGVAKILKAYTFSIMVDTWGDIPFSEANKFKDGITQPKFDKGADIYPKLIALIDEGIANINDPAVNPSKPGNDDIIYRGDLAKWKKAGNTLKLKLYTQQRLVKDVKTEVAALLADPAGLINTHAESFMVTFGPNSATDDRHSGYTIYTAAQRSNEMISPWFYEVLKGYNKAIYTGVEDPRLPYYFYNQKTATATPENQTEYRDGGFVSIVFGSAGPFRDGSNSITLSLLGMYPVGGRYDDGAGVSVSATSTITPANAGTGAAPQKLLTYADRLFLEAELINAGLVTGNESEVFKKAVKSSLEQVDYVVTAYVKPSQSVPALATSAKSMAYQEAVATAFDASATPARKLEYIMTQKWIANYGSAVTSYTDYRRTGYPVMFDPNNPAHVTEGLFQPPVDGNPLVKPQQAVPVSVTEKYPLTLPWPQGELDINGNAPHQKVPGAFKPFWLP
jgi:hypothetical protein